MSNVFGGIAVLKYFYSKRYLAHDNVYCSQPILDTRTHRINVIGVSFAAPVKARENRLCRQFLTGIKKKR